MLSFFCSKMTGSLQLAIDMEGETDVMSRQWYKRQVLSYLPLLFLVIFILLAITFLFLMQQSKKDIVRANGVFAEHVGQVVNYNLKSVENQVLNAALQNDKIKPFFYEKQLDERYFHKYEISKELEDIKVSNPLIDSIYLYRTEDDTVLSDTTYSALDQHGDRTFIRDWTDGDGQNQKWSNARLYRNKELEQPRQVVSLVNNYPPPKGEIGLIVVNVKVPKLKELVDQMNAAAEVSSAWLIGTNGDYIVAPTERDDVEALHRIVTNYMGWEIETGIKDRSLYTFSSGLFYLMLGIAAALLLFGTCWIIYTARSHYKPIQTIMERIIYFPSAKSNIFQVNSNQATDELTFIENAFQQLAEQVLEYEKEQEEGLTFKRRHKLRELTSGNLIWNRTDWGTEASKLNVEHEFAYIGAAIAEVDHYADFVRKYSTRDQYLFQFVLNSVLKEIAEQHHTTVWAEWLEGRRVSILFFGQANQTTAERNAAAICANLSEWVKTSLDFSISIGLGSTISNSEQLYVIHSEAQEALNYKFLKGNGHVISYADLNEEGRGEVYKLIPKIRSFANAYRIGEDSWQDELNQLFRELTAGGFTKSDIYYLINHIIHTLRREMMELSEEVQSLWRNEMLPELERILHGMETVEETRRQLEATLVDLDGKLSAHREKRRHHSLIREVRKYIERHYANPDLSLKVLEDEFGISGKYVSALFRDEIGDKFIDYLAKLRLEHAEKLLVETNATVQDIAAMVGYTNPMTFIRGFRKHYGMTPGDYRKKI